jgi:hypothetical protein
MAKALHLVKGGDASLALATVSRQLAAGDTVTIVAMHGAALPPVPAGVTIRRVPHELSYEGLLEAMFEHDTVIAW